MEFKEDQKFNQAGLWIGLVFSGVLVIGIFGLGFYKQIIQHQQFGNNPMSDNGLIISFILVILLFLLVSLMFGFARLTTMVSKSGIAFKFIPFHLNYRKISWAEIEKCEVITYNPIRDYGGWGLRSGRNGKAYNVSGNKGLLLKLKSGKNILLGTQNEVELKRFLAKLSVKNSL